MGNLSSSKSYMLRHLVDEVFCLFHWIDLLSIREMDIALERLYPINDLDIIETHEKLLAWSKGKINRRRRPSAN